MERIKQAIERARAERLSRDDLCGSAERPDGVAQAGLSRAPRDAHLAPRRVKVSWPALYENRVVGGPEANALVDTYRVLRTQVLQHMTDLGARTLGVTSANPGEGKSLTAVNLAISLAMKVPTLLIDADLRHPSINRFFDVESSAGLAECLVKDIDVQECVFSPGIDTLTVLPGGAPSMNSSELLASPTMLELVASFKSTDPNMTIVFDLPPLLTADDALAFVPHVEAVLLVVEEGKTLPKELARATELLKGTHLLGTVLNKSTQARQTYY